MIQHPSFRLGFAAAAILAAFPASNALAQQSASCVQLLSLVEDGGDSPLRPEFSDARLVAEADDEAACTPYVTRVVDVGGIVLVADAQADDASRDQVTETIEVEQQATIQGEVEVTMPDPEVRVEQDPAEISVRGASSEVSISRGQPVIEIRQAQPIITVRMTQPTISVEQPAPEITITMPRPGVDVATAQPIVEVDIPEPRVTVTQGQPSLDVDLQADVGDAAAVDNGTVTERSEEDGTMVVRANGLSDEAVEPRVQYFPSESEPTVNITDAEPTVAYVAAEPQVNVESDGEPQVELVEAGEPVVRIVDGEDGDGSDVAEDEVASAEEAAPVAALASSEEAVEETETARRDPAEAFAADADAEARGALSTMTVGDLEGMAVSNARGEQLGEVARVVSNDGSTYLIIEHGGWFFGLNDKEFALPVGDVAFQDDRIVLQVLTQEQVDAMPDYDFANEVALGEGDEVTL